MHIICLFSPKKKKPHRYNNGKVFFQTIYVPPRQDPKGLKNFKISNSFCSIFMYTNRKLFKMCVSWPLSAFFTVFSTFSPQLTRVRYRNRPYPAKSLLYRFLLAFDWYTWKCFKMSLKFWKFFDPWGDAWLGQKWSKKLPVSYTHLTLPTIYSV